MDVGNLKYGEHFCRELLVDGKYPLREDQHAVADFIISNKRGYVFNSPRTGKTASALAALQWLHDAGGGPALIICPQPLIFDAWLKEARRMTPNLLKVVALVGSKAERQSLLRRGGDVLVINNAGVSVIFDHLMLCKFGIIIFDELTEYTRYGRIAKNGNIIGTRKFAHAKMLADNCPRVIGMTGTIGDPAQAFSQCKLITPDNMQISEFQWKQRVQVRNPWSKWTYSWYPDAWERARKVLRPCIRFNKEDILEIPEVKSESRTIAVASDTLKFWQDFKANSRVELQNKGAVNGTNAAVMAAKLLQIGAGAVRLEAEDENTSVEILKFNIDSQVDELISILKESESGKIVVFCSFIAPTQYLKEALKARGYKALLYNGSQTASAKSNNLTTWREGDDCDILILHPRSGSYGIELAYADRLIWWGAPMCGKILYAQANERLSSPKQQSLEPKIIKFIFTDADRSLFRALDTGSSEVDALLEIIGLRNNGE